MLTYDHVGTLVLNIEEAKNEYFNLTGVEPTATTRVESQQVQISFVDKVELIQPDEDTILHQLIYKGITNYHVAYRTENFDDEVERLINLNYGIVTDPFVSEVFGNKRCQFFRNNLGHLIEIVEIESSET